MDGKDYYKVMGLEKNATDKEIKIAYRRLARKYHPDLSKEANAEERFKELGEAYEVLKDPEKRKTYDQYITDAAFRKNHTSSKEHTHWGDAGGDGHYSTDFFESLFGGAPHFRQSNRQGADLYSEMSVSLEEAYHGGVKEIRLSDDKGKQQTLKVKIPAGVKTGQQIRLTGLGGYGMGAGARGDLYVTLSVEKHPFFDVKGHHVYLTLPIAPWEAALGSTVVVPTLGGKVDLKIPAGSQGGQMLRLKKRGLPGATQGDQFVILKIVIPVPTTDCAKSFYKKMAEELPFNPRESMGV